MVVVRDVLCRVKSAVRVREEKKLQSSHGIDFARPEKFIGSTVARGRAFALLYQKNNFWKNQRAFVCFLNSVAMMGRRTTFLAAWVAAWGAAAVVGQTEEQQIEAQGFRNIVRTSPPTARKLLPSRLCS